VKEILIFFLKRNKSLSLSDMLSFNTEQTQFTPDNEHQCRHLILWSLFPLTQNLSSDIFIQHNYKPTKA